MRKLINSEQLIPLLKMTEDLLVQTEEEREIGERDSSIAYRNLNPPKKVRADNGEEHRRDIRCYPYSRISHYTESISNSRENLNRVLVVEDVWSTCNGGIVGLCKTQNDNCKIIEYTPQYNRCGQEAQITITLAPDSLYGCNFAIDWKDSVWNREDRKFDQEDRSIGISFTHEEFTEFLSYVLEQSIKLDGGYTIKNLLGRTEEKSQVA